MGSDSSAVFSVEAGTLAFLEGVYGNVKQNVPFL